MARRTLNGVFIGAAIACVALVIQVQQNLFISLDYPKDYNQELGGNSLVKETIVYKAESNGYSEISLDTAQDFVNSLQSIVNLSGCNLFVEENVYSVDDKDLINSYISESKTVYIYTTVDGKVQSCKFLNIDDATKNTIKLLCKGYTIREINNGFTIENK